MFQPGPSRHFKQTANKQFLAVTKCKKFTSQQVIIYLLLTLFMQYDTAFIYPPVIQDSKKHRLACRIFKGNTKSTYNFQKCQCCGRTVGEDQPYIATCYDPTKELVFLGPGVPLLFNFTKTSIFLLLFLCLEFTIYSVISNLQGQSCESPECIQSIFISLSLANKITNSQALNIQNYLMAAFTITFAFLLQYLIFIMRKTDSICDQIINSPSDYSILVSELPEDVSQNDLIKMIEHERWYIDEDLKGSSRNLAVKEIIMSFNLERYLKEIQQQEEQFMQKKKEDQSCHFNVRQIGVPTKVQKFAIIVFSRQSSKNWFTASPSFCDSVKNFFCNLCLKYKGFRVKGKQVVIQRAPEPDDIIWKNSHISHKQVFCNKLISNFCCLVILTLGGLLQYFLQVKKIDLVTNNFSNIFNIASSISINIFNFIIVQFLIFATNKEGDQTKTQRNSSLLVKICIYEFFNAGIFYVFAHVIADQKAKGFNIQGSESYQITFFMLVNAFLPTTLNILFTKSQFPKSIKRLCFIQGCLKYSQKDANSLFQRAQIDFPIKYSFLIKTIWLTCFYVPFTPIVAPISLLGIIYFFFAEQFLFKNGYSVPYMLSNRIAFTAIKLLNYTGIIMLAGSLVVTIYAAFLQGYQLTLKIAIPFIISLIVSILIIVLPSLRINRSFLKVQTQDTKELTYDQAFDQFAVTYKGTNPVSSLDFANKRGEISLRTSFGVMSSALFLQMKNMIGQNRNDQIMNETASPLGILGKLI